MFILPLAVMMLSSDPSATAMVDLARLCGCDLATIPTADSPERRAALSTLGEGAAKRSPARAADIARSLSNATDRKAVFSGVFAEWSKADADGAAIAAGGLGNASDRRDMSRIVARSWAATQPDKTANWIAQMADGPPREAAMIALLESWVQRKPEEAGRWASSLPEGRLVPLPIVAMGGSVSVAGLPYSRAAATQAVALFWARQNGTAALNWASSVADPDLRKLTIALVERYGF